MSTALRNAVIGQATAPKTILDLLDSSKVKQGLAAVAGKFMTADRILRLTINAIHRTPRLLECNPKSVLGAVMATTAIGLEPNTVQQQAFLIPYKRRAKVGDNWVDVYDCQYQIGARGFRTLAYRSPLISHLECEAIHEGDHFKNTQGSRALLEFEKAMKDRGDLIGAYNYVRLKSGAELTCVLPLEEIHKIRSRSETFRTLTRNLENAGDDKARAKAEQQLAETPWVMWADDMASKSATKKHSKQLPLESSEQIVVGAEIDDASDAGILDLETLADPDAVREVVRGEAEPPKLADDTAGQSGRSMEAFGATQRQGEAVEQQPDKKPEPAKAKRKPDALPTYAQLAEQIQKAKDRDAAAVILDEAREQLAPDLLADLGQVFRTAWDKVK